MKSSCIILKKTCKNVIDNVNLTLCQPTNWLISPEYYSENICESSTWNVPKSLYLVSSGLRSMQHGTHGELMDGEFGQLFLAYSASKFTWISRFFWHLQVTLEVQVLNDNMVDYFFTMVSLF